MTVKAVDVAAAFLGAAFFAAFFAALFFAALFFAGAAVDARPALFFFAIELLSKSRNLNYGDQPILSRMPSISIEYG